MTHVLDALGRIKEYWGELALADLADYTRGDIIRGGAADWEAYAIGAADEVLTSDGTDVLWSLSPMELMAGNLLAGLRGFWPMSSFDENGDAFDLSGQGRTLGYNGNPTYNYSNLIPYIDLDGTGDYLDRADEAGLDILGTESYVAGATRGLTIGGWFWTDTLNYGAVNRGFIGKFNTANQRAYVLMFDDASDGARFVISTNGIASVAVTSAALSASAWYFIVGRFEPSTALRVFVNGTWTSNLVGVPASIFNSNADFNVGAFNNGAAGRELDGRASLCFLCTAALSDAIVSALFQQTRAMFNV